ncbi:MAG: bifunctional 3-hydroxydecanoyl-ACP dehydratase/trans-2-decenoyl-ACP isomerase [Proteobacteria bacterium]|nr:bifunctional 3-hydroxydecanoyl-ACP dehydratase/trans-2-decenoyl-ACP isomerase [Pseudomonadota bacterium]MCH8257327.1 bifunctional 3-hydroxydecanoyl-ACP dehydratase/trans-2-decenoyl-ACP isomerase [Pseudomonadota bacterium]
MIRQSSYSHEELIECAHGNLFGPGNAQLPLPPMLMMDRIIKITEDTGPYGKGEVIAELDITPELWFFDCHFEGDPVMPGCLGLDAMWQLLGFFLGWKGFQGRGRARGGEIKFDGTVLPSAKKIVYELHIKRVLDQRLKMGIADAILSVDGVKVYTATNLRTVMTTST